MDTVGDTLRRVAKPVESQGFYLEPPSVYGTGTFLKSVVELVKTHLPCSQDWPDLDGDSARWKLMFNDGYLLDFRTGQYRKGEASDRFSRHCGYPHPEFPLPEMVKAAAAALVKDMHAEWKSAAGGQGGPLSDDL